MNLIDRQAAIDAIKKLSAAETEPKELEYVNCASAMVRMWLDNVVSDYEYYRIMDRLSRKWKQQDL